MPNVLRAIMNIADFGSYDLTGYNTNYAIRINTMGERLEYYLMDAFDNSFEVHGRHEKDERHKEVFSYIGNQNNPPDMILRDGDAFEIKKIQSPRSVLALNNSPPKDRLYRGDPRIIKRCRECDGGNWSSKDIYYVVGYVQQNRIRYLFFAHGICYAADPEVYTKVHHLIQNGVQSLIEQSGLESADTTEPGRIRRVDPLGITSFRIRGMWEIVNPIRVFDYLYEWNSETPFTLITLAAKGKYLSYPQADVEAIESNHSISIQDCEVTDPNNRAERIPARLIVYEQREMGSTNLF